MNSRLEGLFQYLNLLCNVNATCGSNSRSVEKKMLRTCEEIEKELGIEEQKCGTNVKEETENDAKNQFNIYYLCKELGCTPKDIPEERLADILSKQLMDKAKLQGKI